jgi:hypothetical protein
VAAPRVCRQVPLIQFGVAIGDARSQEGSH